MHHNPRDDRDYKVRRLSASTDGRGIPVAATSSPGTLVHTALTSPAANEWDQITLYAVNNSGSTVDLTIEFGGTDTSDRMTVSILANSWMVEVLPPGLVLNNGAELRAYAGSANAVTVFGSVRRYEQEGL